MDRNNGLTVKQRKNFFMDYNVRRVEVFSSCDRKATLLCTQSATAPGDRVQSFGVHCGHSGIKWHQARVRDGFTKLTLTDGTWSGSIPLRIVPPGQVSGENWRWWEIMIVFVVTVLSFFISFPASNDISSACCLVSRIYCERRENVYLYFK